MRLFFAGSPSEGGGRGEIGHYDAGVRNRLVCYTDTSRRMSTGGSRGRIVEFWVHARARALKLFMAAGLGSGEFGEQTVADILRNRMLTYADNSTSGRQARTFWIEQRERAMKLYVAGNGRQAESDKIDYQTGTRNRLLSYAFIEDWADLAFEFWVESRPDSACVFLDSGAFSAYMRGTQIDLSAYCDYIQQHHDALYCYAALDVIKDWRASAKNLDLMLARGLKPIPCFHRGSPWEELERLADEHEYIALGGMVGSGKHDALTPEASGPYLDEAWRHLEKHWPVKVHLFGVVAQWVLERYPFFSADSASAIMGAGMGRVSRFRDGRLQSRGWVDDVEATWDGVVADGVGRTEGKSKSAHAGRRRRNIEGMLALERYVTDLWAARGVVWS